MKLRPQEGDMPLLSQEPVVVKENRKTPGRAGAKELLGRCTASVG